MEKLPLEIQKAAPQAYMLYTEFHSCFPFHTMSGRGGDFLIQPLQS